MDDWLLIIVEHQAAHKLDLSLNLLVSVGPGLCCPLLPLLLTMAYGDVCIIVQDSHL